MVLISNGEKAAGTPVVELAMAKQNSNIEHDHTDAYLQLLLDASIQEAENYTGRALIRRTGVIYAFEGWSDEVLLHTSPVAITGVTYRDGAANAQVLADTEYSVLVRDDRESLRVKSGPGGLPDLYDGEQYPYPIEITMDVGYTAETCPADIKQAILLIFSDNELFREDRPMKLGRSSRVKLRPYRINR